MDDIWCERACRIAGAKRVERFSYQEPFLHLCLVFEEHDSEKSVCSTLDLSKGMVVLQDSLSEMKHRAHLFLECINNPNSMVHDVERLEHTDRILAEFLNKYGMSIVWNNLFTPVGWELSENGNVLHRDGQVKCLKFALDKISAMTEEVSDSSR